jgi:hypothetical protein
VPNTEASVSLMAVPDSDLAPALFPRLRTTLMGSRFAPFFQAVTRCFKAPLGAVVVRQHTRLRDEHEHLLDVTLDALTQRGVLRRLLLR